MNNTSSEYFRRAENIAKTRFDDYNINKDVDGMEKVSVGELLKNRRNELSLTQRQDNMRRDKIAGLYKPVNSEELELYDP